MRLIDADALIAKIFAEWGEDPKYFENDGDPTTGLAAFSDGKALERIAAAPTIEPVNHGMWELVGSVSMCDPFGELAWGKMYRCSECGFVRHFIKDSEHYKFCPNCGARMDE